MILKRFLKITTATLAILGMGFAAACSSTEPVTPSSTYDKEVDAKGLYSYEGATENGLSNFIFCFTTANVSGDEITGPGDVYTFDVYSRPSTANRPLAGTYTFDAANTYQAGTFSQENSFYSTVAAGSNEAIREVGFTAGSLTIMVTGSQVTADAIVTINDERVKLTLTTFTYIEEEANITDLGRDVDLNISQCKARINGDAYNNNTTNFILLGYVNEAAKDRFYLNLIAPSTTSDITLIPAGTYTIGSTTNEFTCRAGVFDGSSYNGSWYDNTTDAGELGLLAEGTVTVSVADGMVYTIEIDAVTDHGFEVKGHYTGYVMHYNPDPNNPSLEPESSSTLEEKEHILDLSNVSSGSLFFFGDTYGIGMGIVVVDLDPAAGSQEGIAMKFLVANPSSRDLEEGTYKASFEPEPNIFMNGYIENNSFEPTALYVYDAQGRGTDVQAPIYAGTIKLTKNGTDWVFEIDAYDDANNHITGSWSGPMEIKRS